jgi:hypothetical protein
MLSSESLRRNQKNKENIQKRKETYGKPHGMTQFVHEEREAFFEELNVEHSAEREGIFHLERDGVAVAYTALEQGTANEIVPLAGVTEYVVRKIEEHLGHEK